MNVMVDTNITLDDILYREPNAEAAREINRLITDKIVTGYLTANSLTDIYYIVSKKRNEAAARKTIKNLLLSFAVVSVDGQDCRKAINLPIKDFEDALVMVCAEKAALHYIITTDKGFLNGTDLSVPAVSPSDFLLMFK